MQNPIYDGLIVQGTMENEVMKAIFERRSVRQYSDEQVPEEVMHTILKAGVMAPSAMNKQPWRFSIVQDRKKIQEYGMKSAELCRQAGIEEKVGFRLDGKRIFFNAPTMVAVSADRDWDWKRDDCNLAIQNMFIAAQSLGIGSCWIGFGISLDNDPEARSELGVPENEEIIATLIFGYPKAPHTQVPEREVPIHAWLKED